MACYEREREIGMWPPVCNCTGDCERFGGCFVVEDEE